LTFASRSHLADCLEPVCSSPQLMHGVVHNTSSSCSSAECQKQVCFYRLSIPSISSNWSFCRQTLESRSRSPASDAGTLSDDKSPGPAGKSRSKSKRAGNLFSLFHSAFFINVHCRWSWIQLETQKSNFNIYCRSKYWPSLCSQYHLKFRLSRNRSRKVCLILIVIVRVLWRPLSAGSPVSRVKSEVDASVHSNVSQFRIMLSHCSDHSRW